MLLLLFSVCVGTMMRIYTGRAHHTADRRADSNNSAAETAAFLRHGRRRERFLNSSGGCVPHYRAAVQTINNNNNTHTRTRTLTHIHTYTHTLSHHSLRFPQHVDGAARSSSNSRFRRRSYTSTPVGRSRVCRGFRLSAAAANISLLPRRRQ